MSWKRQRQPTMAVLTKSLLFISAVLTTVTADPIVETDKGTVRGFTERVTRRNTANAFLGIPFAAPPVGDLRFKPPVPAEPWEGVLNATERPNSCMQSMDYAFGSFYGSTMWNANTNMSEDCLYLNVWTPTTGSENKAVVVWIYGGGFYSGTSTLDIYDGGVFAAVNDVILVSMQYRVGSFGFLSLDSPDAPGNAGLWDQKMALEWVNINIERFGGDPDSITLMGESAGGTSVGLFLLCDQCEGQFNRAILESGSPTASWGVLPKEEIYRRSNVLAGTVECNKDNPSPADMLACLKQVPAQDLVDNEWSEIQGIMQFPFVPIVDGDFIREDPKIMLEKGNFKKTQVLLGSNQDEATFFQIYMDPSIYNRETDSLISSENYTYVMDELMFKYFPTYPIELSKLAQDAIKFGYRDWLNPDDGVENRLSVDRAVSDAYFVCPVNEVAMAYAREDQSVFYYWFNQRWSDNPWPEWMGVLHADEIWFTFGHPLKMKQSFTREEKHLSTVMMAYWANFAKTGDPNYTPGDTDWPLFTEEKQEFRYLNVDAMRKRGKKIGKFPRTKQCIFWWDFLPEIVNTCSKD